MLNFFILAFLLIIIIYFVYIKQYFIINKYDIFFLTTILMTLLTTLVTTLLFILFYYFFNFLIFYIVKKFFISFFFKLVNVNGLVLVNSFLYYLNLVRLGLDTYFKKIVSSLVKFLIKNWGYIYESMDNDSDNTFIYLNYINNYWFLYAERLYGELSHIEDFDQNRLKGVYYNSIRYNPNFNLINRLYINKINNARWFNYTSVMEFNIYTKLHPTRYLIYPLSVRYPSLLLKYYWKKYKKTSIVALNKNNNWAKFRPKGLNLNIYDVDLLDCLTFRR